MGLMDVVWRYDRVILPVVAFIVGAVVVQQSGSVNGTASVLQSDTSRFEFEKAYQQEISDLNKQVESSNKELTDIQSENSNLTDIINQYSTDDDSDGIANYMEEILKTDPDDPDTDKDGFSDLTEIQKGFSPIVSSKQTVGTTATAPSISQAPATSAPAAPAVTRETSPISGGISGTECLIKGTDDKVYYLPGRKDYDSVTDVAKWFCSIEQALGEGFQPPLN